MLEDMNAANSKKTKGSPTQIDVLIGKRLRLARRIAGVSQHGLADIADVTYQQIQKYENGKNRIAASRLLLFANLLGKPVEWFYEPAIDAVKERKQSDLVKADGGSRELVTVMLCKRRDDL